MNWQNFLLVFTIFTSTLIFALCWAFNIQLWLKKYVILSDHIADLITKYPTELTLISTVISTILSVTTTALFSIAVKHALRHYITGTRRPISLIELHTAIALARPAPLLQWNHRRLSLVTLVIVGLIALLNSSWTTLLLPTRLSWPVPIQGKDLDLASPAFDAQLGFDMNGNQSRTTTYYISDIMVSMSGMSATFSVVVGGNDSVFAFNGVAYSKSTGGIVPAVEEFAGTSLTTSSLGLQYYGGKVAQINSSIANDKYSGISRSYNVTQQGLSANVTCGPLDQNDSEYRLRIDNRTIDDEITVWNGTADCPLGSGHGSWATQTMAGGPDGFLAIVGKGEYSDLNTTICKVSPYVASFDVAYSNGNISIDQPQNIQPFQNSSTNVTMFILDMVTWSSQLSNNPLAELLQFDGIGTMHDTLEEYFRGVVEFSATYLRSAYSAEGANTTMLDLYSDESAFRSLNGTMFVTTYGWESGRLTFIYLLGLFTVIWVITVSAAGYSLIQGRTHSGPLFDLSNPVHLIMASSGGGLESLAGFEDDGVESNELVQVLLLNDHDEAYDIAEGGKKFARASGSKMRFTTELVTKVKIQATGHVE
ncbi:uncharacterized protein EDB91DRAFT_1270577 [Suillus paluster]|uniref:uncharacterized protein n=1 Tax=Suillus paluster TaxID=48578 RepID=UPI001B87F228|nr:uncharacterized protein EDB91DRAFT_1270577 [Suillus paluster]KAG1723845.1 hypothetical protein EDB91DRAFT_1270577 [Suillus paluster]